MRPWALNVADATDRNPFLTGLRRSPEQRTIDSLDVQKHDSRPQADQADAGEQGSQPQADVNNDLLDHIEDSSASQPQAHSRTQANLRPTYA